MTTWRVEHGDCLDILPTIPDASVDAVISDPPYPHIKRDYGTLTEDEWWDLMMGVVKETRRILKPQGSAIFILQPNSRRLGSMRGWLWRFMLWVTEEWNMVQDVWWWNISAFPEAHAIQGRLTRPSVKACVWAGDPDCYRNQDNALWPEAQASKARAIQARINGETERVSFPSGQGVNRAKGRDAAARRGGVTPMNLFPASNNDGKNGSGAYGHGAGTPLIVADWWTRFIVPAGGLVVDPFCGAGTMGVAALQNGASFVGIEKMEKYADISRQRIADVERKQNLTLFAQAAD